MSAPRAEWKGRAAFAPFADALAVTTADVLAAWSNDAGTFGVLYTPEGATASDYVRQAVLARDADGILRVRSDIETDLTVTSMARGR